MPPGAKKRKALKKKQLLEEQQEQESIGASTNNKGFNGDNLHGNDELGSQDDRESDSTLSSPGSQGNEQFGVAKDSSAAATSSALVVNDTTEKISHVTQGPGPKSGNDVAVERGTDDKNNSLEKSPISSNGKSTHTAKNVASQDSCGDSIKEISPVVGSVSQVVISQKSEHAEKEYQSLDKDNGKVDTLLRSADGTGREAESVRESEAPVSSEEKRLLLPGPQTVRTSWLSCCGLFHAMTGSDR